MGQIDRIAAIVLVKVQWWTHVDFYLQQSSPRVSQKHRAGAMILIVGFRLKLWITFSTFCQTHWMKRLDNILYSLILYLEEYERQIWPSEFSV